MTSRDLPLSTDAVTPSWKATGLVRRDSPLAKQPQFPQPLLIRLLLQTLHQLRCPSLDTLQHLNVPLVVGGPKLNTVFQVRPHQCRVQGHDHFPSPAGHTISDTSQDAIGLLGYLGTLLAHIQPAAAFQPLFPKPVALHGVVVTQVQSPPTLKQINTSAQLGVICKLTALDPLIQIIDKDIKQNWPQHRALGNTTCDRPPTGVNSIHHHSLGPAIRPVFYPVKRTPVQAMSSQFLQENAVGNRVKGFTKVQVYPICHQQAWCHVHRPMIKKPDVLLVTAGSEPGIDLLALPVSFLIIPCNWKDREHYWCS
ncbi:hypothetical protein QYF61_014038 [Mycteria americana]|uniref:Uncharacterized protein n=1 Tax=Mycteria americana TaxID=33587 RepID=A0AAN7PD95_MYCAM|nr:hypothetical protein QYF61_014038 [Mycteria americana]